MNKIFNVYEILHEAYGPQGWWPYINDGGYHPADYNFNRNEDEIFEVCLGSILTQNTTFTSVVKSLNNLNELNALTPKAIKKIDIGEFKEAIKPSGYFNQKAKYILEFISFFEALNGKTPSREGLLKVLGIGEETADSILLYGYCKPEFKVDAYTKRVFLELGLINEKAKYKDIKKLMQESLRECIKDERELVIVYQEFHALIVKHSKEFYSKKPYSQGCFLKEKYYE
ncbi:endonuclease III domain-containing protein [Candidatus Sulfurimonas baltica]|uniref:Endonuclease III domain-containing protein n=1 Tax=Candidatus Sulfurimonas baltica TaxID=2740404 RepID=A0A7S7LVR6_9BACT|nr:endonuclease III domain-containing protein [Candidatus Sulfurimonas baltica]QOY51753.1 endonuclease III domain-containing protein [Candidatus Sulfurimonas baltica]